MYINENLIKQQTLQWIQSFILKYNICPFAKKVITEKTLTIQVLQEEDTEALLQAIISAVVHLDKHPSIETTLLVLPSHLADFFDYLDFVALIEDLFKEQGYEGVYQLATFHPNYCFAGVDENDASNYTNRSPYPMLHLLRESSIDKAIDFYGDTDDIPEKNIATMHRLGLSKIKQLLKVITNETKLT